MRQYIILAAGLLALTGCGSKTSSDKGGTDTTTAADTAKTATADIKTLEPQGNPLENAEARVTNGFIIAGTGPETRAFTTFKSGEGVSRPYIQLINDLKGEFPKINFYAIVIPGQAAYYVPKKVADKSKPMKPAFDYLKANLNPEIKYIDVYNTLGAHTKEDIYLRTDHHWAPLGAYYVAQQLAAAAGVPFKDLSDYDEHIVHGYVGSMPKYTGDNSLRNAPEDFHYYTPRGTNEKTTYIAYITDKDKNIISEKGPYEGDFFHHYSDGAGGAYCAFMGGDHYIVKVETGVPNSRRILLIKDSHGNPIPAYLFHSFEEIHVIDYRYFKKNLKKYIEDNKISDIALAFGINTSSSTANMQKIRDYLKQ